MKTQATAKFVGTSARKTGLVAALIRGHRALEAQRILLNVDKRAAGPVGKVLASAIANAENNHGLKAETLRVSGAFAQTAGSFKRFVPKARGSAGPIIKRNSHIKIVLSDN